MTAQASGRQGWLAPACQLGNRSLFWATNRLTHGFLQRYQIFPQPFSIPPSGSALGRYCKRLRVYPVSLQSPWVNLYMFYVMRNRLGETHRDSRMRKYIHTVSFSKSATAEAHAHSLEIIAAHFSQRVPREGAFLILRASYSQRGKRGWDYPINSQSHSP